jgi:hypothetical protein
MNQINWIRSHEPNTRTERDGAWELGGHTLLTVTHRSATRRGTCQSGEQVGIGSEQREGGAAAEDERTILCGDHTEAGLVPILRSNLLVARIE